MPDPGEVSSNASYEKYLAETERASRQRTNVPYSMKFIWNDIRNVAQIKGGSCYLKRSELKLYPVTLEDLDLMRVPT